MNPTVVVNQSEFSLLKLLPEQIFYLPGFSVGDVVNFTSISKKDTISFTITKVSPNGFVTMVRR